MRATVFKCFVKALVRYRRAKLSVSTGREAQPDALHFQSVFSINPAG